MENQKGRIVAMLLVVCLMLVCGPACACSGGSSGGSSGGNSEGGGSNYSPVSDNSPPTGVKTNGSVQQGAYGVTLTPQQIKDKWRNERVRQLAGDALRRYQTVESVGDISLFATQYGVLAFSYKYVNRVLFWPFATVWQISKHTSRIGYGLVTGKMETVYEVNKRSYNGKFVNWLIIQRIK